MIHIQIFRIDKPGTEDENTFLVVQKVLNKSETNIHPNATSATNTRSVENYNDPSGVQVDNASTPFWKKCLCCQPCKTCCKDTLWALEVRCVKLVPRECHTTWFCSFINMVSDVQIDFDFE